MLQDRENHLFGLVISVQVGQPKWLSAVGLAIMDWMARKARASWMIRLDANYLVEGRSTTGL